MSTQPSADDALIRRLRILLEVIRTGGVSDAARALGVSQPAITNQIRSLETDLGLTLFRRTGRRLVVTDKGAQIAETARRLLGELSLGLDTIRDAARGAEAQIRIGFSAPHTALRAAQTFRASDPGTRLIFRAANTTDLFEALDRYELDIIMIGLDAPRTRYHCQLYERQHLTALFPADHPLASDAPLTLTELASLPIVLREEGSFTRWIATDAFKRAGLVPYIATTIATREAVAEATLRGFGIGLVLSSEQPHSQGLRCRPITPTIDAADYLVCHLSALSYPPVARFLDAARPG